MEAVRETRLLRLLSLGLEVAGGAGTAMEVAGEDGLEDGAEDDLGTAGDGVSCGRGVKLEE